MGGVSRETDELCADYESYLFHVKRPVFMKLVAAYGLNQVTRRRSEITTSPLRGEAKRSDRRLAAFLNRGLSDDPVPVSSERNVSGLPTVFVMAVVTSALKRIGH